MAQKEPKTVTPLDQETYEKIKGYLVIARNTGQDPIEALHRWGFILSPAVDADIRIQALEYVREQLQSWRAVEMLRRNSSNINQSTPADLYRAVWGWLDALIANAREEAQGARTGPSIRP